MTHVHRRSIHCRPDCTWQVAVSGRSHDTRTQAVFPAGQTALGRSPCQGGATTHVHRRSSLQARPHSAGRCVREGAQHTFTVGQIAAGQTALARSPCQGGAVTHVHRRSNPCQPDRTRQVAVSGISCDTRSQAVKSLPARPHSAGHRAKEEPRHRYTCGQPCWPDHTH